MMRILKSEVAALGFDLDAAADAYRAALAAHARTVGKAAPTAHPLVEAIVRQGVVLDIVNDDPVPVEITPPTVDQMRVSLMTSVVEEERRRIDAVMSPGRARLATMDMYALRALPSRNAAEERQLAAIEAAFAEVAAIQRRGAELTVEIEDLPDASVPGWTPDWEAR